MVANYIAIIERCIREAQGYRLFVSRLGFQYGSGPLPIGLL